MSTPLRIVDRVLAGVMVLLVAAMLLSVTGEIALREIVQPLLGREAGAWISRVSSPINTASQVLLIWIAILGSAYAPGQRAHLGVDALVRVYPPRVRRWVGRGVIALIALFSLAVMLTGGILLMAWSLRSGSMMPGFPGLNRAWFYAVLPLTGALTRV